jgi:hypothetical protein
VGGSLQAAAANVVGGFVDARPPPTTNGSYTVSDQHGKDTKAYIAAPVLRQLSQAVAANDVGRFVEFHPHGRYIVSDLRGKEMLMRLMASSDLEVQKRALLAVQRIMLPKDKLDFLQAASSGA